MKEAPEPGEACKTIRLTKKEYQRLCSNMLSDFQIVNDSRQLIDHPGYGFHDRFYEAIGTYNLFKTCNVWTGDRLSGAGVKVACWTPFDWGVFSEL